MTQQEQLQTHFLQLQVSAYEAKIAPIPLDLNVPSPLQHSDLNKPDSDETAPPQTEPDNSEK